MHEGLLSLVGKTVGQGRFRLDRVLGQGGMGAVFEGVELSTARPVAIKVMHPGLADESSALKRFAREAEVTRRLEHPHVVEVIAAGGGDGEPPFIAMERLEGASLSELVKRGETFDAQRAIRIARQVLAAVAAGHRIGVVHRDLKPANVMLLAGSDAESEVVKVVDYGVARLAMTEAMTRLTSTGQVVGTPSYMSPQQAMGEPAGPEADVYAVGAILHRLLAGEPPYGQGQYVDLLERMVVDARTRIHERVKGLGRLADVIERALAHDPEGRYPTADAMNDALASLDARPKTTVLDWRPPPDLASLRLPPAEGDPPPRRPEVSVATSVIDANPGRSRSRPLLVALALVLVAAMGSAGTWLWLRDRGDAPDAQASTGAASSTIGDLAAPTAVSPVAIASQPIDAGRAPDADAAPSPERAERSQQERAARPSMRARAAPRVIVVYGGGELGSRVHYLRLTFEQRVDLTPCWPEWEPLPEFDRGADFLIELDTVGTPLSVRPESRKYFAFVNCAASRLSRTNFGPGEAETIRLVVSFHAVSD